MASWPLDTWLTFISALTAAIVTVINALKIEKVHRLVNSDAEARRTEIASLKSMLLVKQSEIDNFNKEI